MPYGLRNVRREDRSGIFREVDPVEGPVVARMVEELLAGRSLRAIADGLNTSGIATPRARDAEQAGRQAEATPWSYTAVRRVLSNPPSRA